MIEIVISLTVSVPLRSILELCQTSFPHNGQLLVCTFSLFLYNLRAQALWYWWDNSQGRTPTSQLVHAGIILEVIIILLEIRSRSQKT